MSSGSAPIVAASSRGTQPPIEEKIITIPVCLIGKAIGKAGTTIKALQARSGAKISIDENGQVKMTGNIGQIRVAEFHLMENLGESKVIPVKPGLDKELIEKGVIQSIMSSTGATINVSDVPLEERSVAVPIEIYGSSPQIARAERLIKDALITSMKPVPKPVAAKSSKSKKTLPKGIWMTQRGPALKLAHVPDGVTKIDVLKLYRKAANMPTDIRIGKTSDVKKNTSYTTVSIKFENKGVTRIWREQMDGKILLGVPIVKK